MQQKKLLQNYKNLLQEHLSSRGFRPQTSPQLQVRLNILPAHSTIFDRALAALQEEGLISLQEGTGDIFPSPKLKGNEGQEPWEQQYVQGTLSLSPRGFGFCRIDQVEGEEMELSLIGGEVFIPKDRLRGAMHKDHISVRITGKDHRGFDGEVIRIISHSEQTLYGIIKGPKRSRETQEGEQKLWQVHLPLMADQSFVARISRDSGIEETQLKRGSRVALKKGGTRSTESRNRGRGERESALLEVIELCGDIEDASEDLDFAMGEYGLEREFPPDCLEETRDLGLEVTQQMKEGREDLTRLATLTIDPTTARDFDDAISIELLEEEPRILRLYVHIADVPAYVSVGTALDREAKKRGNSTYLPGHCIAMLPSELSNELCSLKPHVERLAITTVLDFDAATGERLSYRFTRSVIKSKHRFTYEEAMALLEYMEPSGKEGRVIGSMADCTSWQEEQLFLMRELYNHRAKLRKARGMITMALPEAKLNLDEEGKPLGLEVVEYDLSHQIIEEFMVTTNEAVAQHLRLHKLQGIFRLHEAPDAKSFEPFQQLIASLGYDFQVHDQHDRLHHFFDEISTSPHYAQICISYIRCMKMAIYSETGGGHYGLRLDDYCHFTSPIRRYSDLLTMRALLGEKQTLSWANEAIYLSERERNSAQAEMSVATIKKWRLLQRELEVGKCEHEALISKVMPFGVSFALQGYFLEVFIPIAQLSPTYLTYVAAKQRLVCGETDLQLAPGQKVSLRLLEVDLIHKEGRWELLLEGVSQVKRGTRGEKIKGRYDRIADRKRTKRKGDEPIHAAKRDRPKPLRDRSDRSKASVAKRKRRSR